MFYCFWGLVIVAHTPPFIYFRLIVFFFLKTFHGLLTAPRNKTTKFTPPAQMQNYEEIPNYSSPHTHTHTHLPLQSCLTPAQIVSHTYREVPFCCWKMVWFFSSALPDLQERSHCYSQEFPKASYAYYGWILSRFKKKKILTWFLFESKLNFLEWSTEDVWLGLYLLFIIRSLLISVPVTIEILWFTVAFLSNFNNYLCTVLILHLVNMESLEIYRCLHQISVWPTL